MYAIAAAAKQDGNNDDREKCDKFPSISNNKSFYVRSTLLTGPPAWIEAH